MPHAPPIFFHLGLQITFGEDTKSRTSHDKCSPTSCYFLKPSYISTGCNLRKISRLCPYQVFVSPTDARSCLYQLPVHNTRTALCTARIELSQNCSFLLLRHAQEAAICRPACHLRVTAAPYVTFHVP